jgi:TonB family protein
MGMPVGVVGSGLAGNEGTPREAKITSQEPDRLEIAAAIADGSIGSPVVDASGEVVGVVISAGEKAAVRPSTALGSFLSHIVSDAKARWPRTAETSPTPKSTPKPQIVYAPAPRFPSEAHAPVGAFGSGRFRISFNANGNVKNVEIIQSTGNDLFDQAASSTLQQWKATPGREWVTTVPVTFEAR